MKQTKKWLITFLSFLLAGLLFIAAAVIYVDPFFQYHKPLSWFPYRLENQLTQNPGMAKNLDYDSVLLGSSMTLRFDTRWFRELFDLETIKLTYNAAYPLDQATIFEKIDESDNSLKAVFLGIDITTYCGSPDTRAYPLQTYLYDQNYFNDLEYLFNKDVLIQYLMTPILKGQKEADSFHTIYNKYYNPTDYSRDIALANYHPLTEREPVPAKRDAYLDNLRENMTLHILPYLEKHSDVRFYIFFPPYSILFWHDAMQKNNVAARMAEYECLVELLAQYPNVELYFFAGDEEIITNLDNYTDYTHFSQEISRLLTQYMAEGTDRITLDNYKEKIQALQQLAENYDYGQWNLP